MVYLYAGLEIGSAVPHAILRESDIDLHVLGSQGSSWASSSAVSGDRPGWEALAISSPQALIHDT